MILVVDEYQADVGEVTMRMICLRLEENSGRGTCWIDGGDAGVVCTKPDGENADFGDVLLFMLACKKLCGYVS